MDKEKSTFPFAIARIKDQGFSINEAIDVDFSKVLVSFNNSIDLIPERETIEFTVQAHFFMENLEIDNFLSGKALTSFHLQNMNELINEPEDGSKLPLTLLSTMFSIAFTHTRALIAKAAMGSKFETIYLPIINPTEMLKDLITGNPIVKQEG